MHCKICHEDWTEDAHFCSGSESQCTENCKEKALRVFDPIIQEWINQGRDEHDIWAVRNFFTGIGGVRLLELINKK